MAVHALRQPCLVIYHMDPAKLSMGLGLPQVQHLVGVVCWGQEAQHTMQLVDQVTQREGVRWRIDVAGGTLSSCAGAIVFVSVGINTCLALRGTVVLCLGPSVQV